MSGPGSPEPAAPQDSPYASPPPSPYGPPPVGYGQQASGQQASGQPAYGLAPGYGPAPAYQPPMAPYGPQGPDRYAHWGLRVGARLLDLVFALPALVLTLIGVVVITATSDARGRATSPGFGIGIVLVVLGYAGMIGLEIWNRWFKAGRTGYSWGKKVVGTPLLSEATGQPIGAGMAFARDLAHILDGFFYLGYLWPLWDAKRQTFADKVCSTVVLGPDRR